VRAPFISLRNCVLRAAPGTPSFDCFNTTPSGGHNSSVRISIVGFGLIGGSIARALRERSRTAPWHVTAWSRNPAPVRQAVADGVVQRAATSLREVVDGADIVLLAAPPLVCLDLIDQLAQLRTIANDGCTYTDVASAKSSMVQRANAVGLPFIGGHPMAGREVTGYASAMPDLFVGRPWVTVIGDHARLGDGERVSDLVRACGAIQVPMKAEAHDMAVAAISHMPLIVSAAIVEAVVGGPGQSEREDWIVARALAATGWASMTRLARGDASMGAGIAATNTEAIAARVRDVRDALDDWLRLLDEQSGPQGANDFFERFESARQRLLGSDEA
jgi:prephenate dehydrogenase